MFHEVAHGLGIKNTLDGKGTVRAALKERASGLEEGKADILGLYMVGEAGRAGRAAGPASVNDNYVTFLAGLFRSVRFGAGGRARPREHGDVQLLRRTRGAFTRDRGRHVPRGLREDARRRWTRSRRRSSCCQGDGDYAGVGRSCARWGSSGRGCKADLARLAIGEDPGRHRVRAGDGGREVSAWCPQITRISGESYSLSPERSRNLRKSALSADRLPLSGRVPFRVVHGDRPDA